MQNQITWEELRQTSLGRRLLTIGALCLLAILIFIASTVSTLDKAQEAQAQLQQAQAEISQLQANLDGQTKSLEQFDSLVGENSNLKAQVATLQDTTTSQESQIADKDAYIEQLEAKLSTASSKSSGAAATTSGNSSNEIKPQTVYVTKTGSKYHRSGYQYLKKSKIAISLADAKAQGYTACSKCY